MNTDALYKIVLLLSGTIHARARKYARECVVLSWTPRVSRLIAVAVAFVVVLAPMLGFIAPTTAAGPPPGMVNVPDDQVTVDLPKGVEKQIGYTSAELEARLEGHVLASDHAGSLEVLVTTPGQAKARLGPDVNQLAGSGPIAVVATDDAHPDGRRIALPAEVLTDLLGFTPKMWYGTHDTGARWKQPVTVRGGYVVGYVPHFSTNTVTFSGQIQISATPATDGSSYSYDVDDLDAASNFDINVTGHTTTEWDNLTTAKTATGQSAGISVGGNLAPTGPSANGKPVLTVTGERTERTMTFANSNYNVDDYEISGTTSGGNGVNSEWEITNPPESVERFVFDKMSVKDSNGDGMQTTFDIYIAQEGADGVYAEGTLVKTNVSLEKNGISPWVITLSSEYDASTATTLTVAFVANSTSADTEHSASRTQDDTVKSGAPSSVTIDADDGTSHSFGDVAVGSSESAEFALSENATQLTVNANDGSVTMELEMKERTQTEDPAVEVNGHWTNYTGTISDGSTVQLSTDTSWLTSGTNRINVSVAPGLSSDAPTPSVDLDYNHHLTDNQSVDYAAEKWTERYNVSETFATERQTATLKIPFADGAVVSIRSIDYRINKSGGWTAVDPADYSFAGTTLTVDLDGVYGGAIPAGTTMEVRANGSKVQVNNGSITVLDPSGPGEKYDIKVKVESWADDSYIDTSGTSKRIHYTYSEDWNSPAEVFEVTSSGAHRLHMDGASAGDTARVSTIPVTATPKSGEVHLRVEDPMSTEPQFQVLPGPSTGDTVTYTLMNAEDGKTYQLYSKTHNAERDRGTASSPLTLEDDDSDETLVFRLVSSSGSGGGGGAGGGGGVLGAAGSALGVPLTVLAIPVGLVLLVVLNRRLLGGGAVEQGDTTVGGPLGRIPGIGAVAGAIRGAFASPVVVLGFVGMLGVVAVRFGLISISEQVQGVIAIMAGFGGVSLALWRIGRLRAPLVAGIGTLAFVAIAELLNPGSILGPIGRGLGQSVIVVAAGAFYLAYRWLKARKGPQEVNRIVISDDEDSNQ